MTKDPDRRGSFRPLSPTVPTPRTPDPAALANLHADARAHVLAGRSGPLESRAAQPHSSQALCVSVWGALERRPPWVRDRLVSVALRAAGLKPPNLSDVEVETEVRHHRELLGEQRGGTPTSIDALITWPGGVIAVESKFTEREFGHCGQVKWRRGRIESVHGNCTGDHAVGSDNKPSTKHLGAACRLTVADGSHRPPRLYWDLAPAAFREGVLAVPQSPCPFAGDAYQLMRNVLFAHAYARAQGQPWSAALICLVEPAPAAAVLRQRAESFRSLLNANHAERVGILGYRQLSDLLASEGELELHAWIDKRIEDGLTHVVSVAN